MLDPIPRQIAIHCDEPEVPICCEVEMDLQKDEFNGYWHCAECDETIDIK